MNAAPNHLLLAPILLPFATAVLMLFVGEQRRTLKATINVLSTLLLVGVAILLLRMADADIGAAHIGVYRLGDWPAPFGIVLVLDRLSALMLALGAVLAVAALLFAIARWHRAGAHFHPLFQLQLMGLNGAFLTGDLFNLFVFFEVLLAASYGLLLHGTGPARVRAGVHYIAINLTASSLFLIGAALIYGVTGTLNMADIAARAADLPPGDRALLEAGAAVLGIVFLVKAGMWPLSFWLPAAYSAGAAPVVALFAILSKVGIYAVLRMGLLLFDGDAAGFGNQWLFYGGVMTVIFGSVGALAAQETARLAAYSVLISSGTLLAVLGAGQSDVTASALFYLVSSTLGLAALFLLVELIERGRRVGADILAVTMEAFGDPEDAEEEVGVAIPATMALLGLSFVFCALLLAGLPPLSGFIAKFAILSTLLGVGEDATVPTAAWALLALLLISGMTSLVAMARVGVRSFWTERNVPRVRLIEVAPIGMLLCACAVLTVQAAPFMRYMEATAASLHAPQYYVKEVLSAPRAQEIEP